MNTIKAPVAVVRKPYVARTYSTYSESVLNYLQLKGKGALERDTREDIELSAIERLTPEKLPFACFEQFVTIDDFWQRLYCRYAQIIFAKQCKSDPRLMQSLSIHRQNETLRYIDFESKLRVIGLAAIRITIDNIPTYFDKPGYEVREIAGYDITKQQNASFTDNWFSVFDQDTSIKTSLLIRHPFLKQRLMPDGTYSQDIAIIDTRRFLTQALETGLVAALA